MRRVNLTALAFNYDETDPDGFRSGLLRTGRKLGAKQTGATVYELPPGQAVCPYHYEYAEEEWLLVLTGRPTLREPDGRQQLEVDDLVFFPTGPEGAHQIVNETEETARVLLWSTVVLPTATVYPDSDKIGIWTGNPDDNIIVQRAGGVEYFRGEGG